MRESALRVPFLLAVALIMIAAGRLNAADAPGAACRVRAEFRSCNGGSCGTALQWGSGTLIVVNPANQDGMIVTAAHVLQDDQTKVYANAITVYFADGSQHRAEVIVVDRPADLAALKIRQTRATPAPVTMIADDGAAQFAAASFTAAGFGENGQYRAVSGPFAGLNLGTPQQVNLQVQTTVRQGDSGGGLFNAEGKFVGVVWGCRAEENLTFCTTGGPLRRLIDRACGGRGQVVYGAGGAAPPPAAAATCQCDARLAAIDARLAAIDASLAKLDAELKTRPERDELAGYLKREELPEHHPPDLSQFATRDEIPTLPDLSGLATEVEVVESHNSILDRVQAVAGKAAEAAHVAAAAKAAAAAGSGGLFAGWGYGAQLAAVLGLGGGPATLLGIVGFIGYRRLKKRLAGRPTAGTHGGDGGRRDPTFH